MKIHPIAHRIYLRIKAELTDGLPPEAHDLIISAANLTEERINDALKQCIQSGLTHRQAEDHLIALFNKAKELANEGTALKINSSPEREKFSKGEG